jgi:hypothetical protein
LKKWASTGSICGRAFCLRHVNGSHFAFFPYVQTLCWIVPMKSPVLTGCMILVTSCAAWLLGVRSAAAEQTLPSHAYVQAHTLYGGVLNLPGSEVILQGDGILDTTYLQDSTIPEYYYSGAARAITNIQADKFLKAYSSAHSDGSGFFPNGLGYGQAVWRDVARVAGSTPPPAIRLGFQIDGNLDASSVSLMGFPENLAQFRLSWSTNASSVINAFNGLIDGADLYASSYSGNQPYEGDPGTEVPGPSQGLTTRGNTTSWDSTEFIGTHFTGTFSFEVPYDAEWGGYVWKVSLVSYSYAAGGSAEADALGTMKLTHVTTTDGAPLSVTFESGLSVPEPASLALLFIGATATAGFLWIRGWRWRTKGSGVFRVETVTQLVISPLICQY